MIRRNALLGGGKPLVRVSSASARLKFISCGPICIARGCTAKCCDAPTHPTGIRVYVHPDESHILQELHGATAVDGFLKPDHRKLCPFKREDNLCALFNKPERPLGCVVSPFMLNKNNVLIIRNRYRLLPCYDKVRGNHAYLVFMSSLIAMFGQAETEKLVYHLDNDGYDILVPMLPKVWLKMLHREESLHGRKPG